VDLRLYARVLWRFRFLVVLGLLVGTLLALLAATRIEVVDGSPRLSYRENEQWESKATLLVTEHGFPEGYSAPSIDDATEAGSAPDARFADPNRLASLAVVYAHLAQTGPIRRLLQHEGLADATIDVTVRSSQAEGALPFIDLVASSSSPEAATAAAVRGAAALRDYIVERQMTNAVPSDERVVLEVLGSAGPADLVAGRPKAAPVLAFLAVMLTVLAAVFVLDNLRPRWPTTRRVTHISQN
jgi:hypothetical protein